MKRIVFISCRCTRTNESNSDDMDNEDITDELTSFDSNISQPSWTYSINFTNSGNNINGNNLQSNNGVNTVIGLMD